MAIGDAGDKGDIWPRQTGQIGNFASRIHAHFLNRKINLLRQAGEADRHTNMIVETTLTSVTPAKLRQGMP